MSDNSKVCASTNRCTSTTSTRSTDATDGASDETDAPCETSSDTSTDVKACLDRARRSREKLADVTGGRSNSGRGGATGDFSTTSAQDLQAANSGSPSSREAWREQQAVRELGQNIQLADDLEALTDSSLSEPALDGLSFEELATLRKSPERLRKFIGRKLAKHHDVGGETSLSPLDGFETTQSEKLDRATGAIVGQIEDEFTKNFKNEIKEKAVTQVEDSLELTETLNRSPRSRRRFLANLTARLGSSEQVEKALAEKGVPSDDASTIAETVSELDRKGADLETFLDGSRSPQKLDRAAGLLKNHFDSMESELRDFESRAKADAISDAGRDLLHDGNYAGARAAVLDELGLDPNLAGGNAAAADSELGEFVADEIGDAETAAEAEGIFNTVVTTAASGAAGFITGGGAWIAGGVAAAGSTASNVPSVSRAFHEVSVTKGAEHAGTAAPGAIEDARAARDVAVVTAVADVALAGTESESIDSIGELLVDTGTSAAEDEVVERLATEADAALRRELGD